MLLDLDHVQIALPRGAETKMRQFYCNLLGMTEITKLEALAGRGGFWALAGAAQVHFGIDPEFRPAMKAHPCFIAADLDNLAKSLELQNVDQVWDDSLPDVRRLFVADPVGNRVELMGRRL